MHKKIEKKTSCDDRSKIRHESQLQPIVSYNLIITTKKQSK